MELASAMKRGSMTIRRSHMRAFAEGEVQRAINGAKNRGDEFADVDVRNDIDMDMLKSYIQDFGYDIDETRSSDRKLYIKWDDPKK